MQVRLNGNNGVSNANAFQSTHPLGCDLLKISNTAHAYCFNPRTHMGCDGTVLRICFDTEVSIHAPTWGATLIDNLSKFYYDVSIHAPTWGATFADNAQSYLIPCFNPRTHMGCDLALPFACFDVKVSIHAPTWGATRCLETVPPSLSSFNPRTHMGCDVLVHIHKLCLGRFQSTHPHGVRLRSAPGQAGDCQFQSTHPHGVRPLSLINSSRGSSFNPRTHMGCDFGLRQAKQEIVSFNPRTHMGCDR